MTRKDFIDRDAAIEMIARLREKCGNTEMAFSLNWAIERLRKFPAADVVEVVRCKDCVCYENAEYEYGIKKVCRLFNRVMQEDDFCSLGGENGE